MTSRYSIRFGRFLSVVLSIFGFGPFWSHVDLDDAELRVRMGWGFSGTIPRRSIVGSGRRGYVWWAYGVHYYGKGIWIVNGSGKGMVTVDIDPPARGRVLGVPVKLRGLWLSLEDPDGFLAAIGPPPG